ncbi:MAG: SOS response-associated peptidase [Smithellaceae bacterium]
MCGRFVLITDLSVIAKDFDIPSVSVHFSPSRNVIPGQHIPAIFQHDLQNMMTAFLWGLIPFWAKDPSIGGRLINARAETIAQKPSFKNAFAHRRCLIPADGFYEWKTEGKKKTPYEFFLKSQKPFTFAGLYERWIGPNSKPVDTCTILTTEANDVVRPVHDRMPVIIPEDQQTVWLDNDIKDAAKLQGILKPYPARDTACRQSGKIC